MAPDTLHPRLIWRATGYPSTSAGLSAAVLSALHERVQQGDRSAFEDFAGHMLSALRPRLRAAFPRVDQDTVNDAAEDAILQHLMRPQRFDPTRGVPLDRFLYLVAWRRLANHLRDAAARTKMDLAYAGSIAFVHHQDESDNARDGQRADRIRRMLAVVPDARERQGLRYWLAGEPAPKLAIALGFGGRSPREQEQEVKRFKDRIRARLRRHRS